MKGLRMNLDCRSQTQVLLGLAEREVFPWLEEFAGRAAIGIDVGAAEGEYALYLLSRSTLKRVLAFDPSDRFPADLEANLALNGLHGDPRLTCVNRFVGDRDDEGSCTLDSFAAELDGPCVIKIDVDGGELAVLKGAGRWLGRRDVSWIIETHAAELERECEAMLKAAGLTTRIVKNAWWRAFVPELRPIPHNRWLVAWSDTGDGAGAFGDRSLSRS
jgi:hypothetical protein